MGYLFCREMRQPKCLFFVLLIWCLGTVHAQDSQRSCLKPKLDRGYFDSDEGTYPHGTELYYACDKGWKPVADGWWGMVKCENRKWSHIPQCIDENSCIPPDNPNAKEKPQNVNGWYPNGERVWFDCDSTHEIKGSTSAKCENGSWTELPLCVEKDNVCGKPPPVVTHAVIIHKYQDKFPEDTTINYKCQDSYTLEGTDSTVCLSGGWTKGPTCILTPSPTEWPSTGEGGSSTSSDRGNGGTSSGGDHSTSSGDEASSNVRPSARPQPSGPFLPVGCKLDARSYYWLDLIQDLFLKDGRQTLNCKQKDYWGRPLVADVQCQNGHLTSSSCYQPN
ncbi:coagulation factor XIII B chain isoform X4 [Salmo trutta]|uniref:coagulation factor XIII B chain isoform X4 n=1 Tax=Salmo trutta TaxID=8032 RepID=UPI0011315A02|nr:coagulation factor XIII B chain-like isoform X4 [Salmo trutta]